MRHDIAVLYFPWRSQPVYKFIDEVLTIIERIDAGKVYVIGGNSKRLPPHRNTHFLDVGFGMHYLKEKRPVSYSALLWILKVIAFQVTSSAHIFRHRSELRKVVFYLAYPYHLMPLLVSKALRISTVEVVTRGTDEASNSTVENLLNRLYFALVDHISPESNSLLTPLIRKRYEQKIVPPGYRYVDLERFKVSKEFSKRSYTVGFIGRLVEEKGIRTFINAIPVIATETKSISFIIGGTGPLLDWVSDECRSLSEKHGVEIEVMGFIPDENFPEILNELKVLVFPSYHNEGLPTILLESLACGTPVLATRVGAVQDVIKENETGFFISSGDQEDLAKQILSRCHNSSLDEIAKKGRYLIERDFSIDSALIRWKKII